MMIIHGTRRTERTLGYVADFCAMCRKPTPQRLIRIGVVSHVYGISFGQGKLAGHDGECLVCRTRSATEPERYRTPAPRFDAGEIGSAVRMQQLEAQTFPQLRERHRKRLEIEETVRREPERIDPATRRGLIMEPFVLLAPRLEQRIERTHFDLPLALTALAALLVTLGALVVTDQFGGPDAADIMPMVGAATALVGIVAVVVQAKLAHRRFVRRVILPQALAALQPLRASAAEIEAALAVLRKDGSAIARRISSRDLAAFAPAR